jgi:diaminopimelate epimerase
MPVDIFPAEENAELMDTLTFTKMNGAGNDFVMVDNRQLNRSLTQEQIAKLCDRHRGVGADGLLAVEPAENGADVRMRYYNADGGEAEMCGNGARCFARFVNQLNGGKLVSVSFETMAGVIGAEFIGEHVRLKMSVPHGLALGTSLDAAGDSLEVHFLNTGVPHAVVLVDDLAAVPVVKWGAALRYHTHFQPKGTNANFASVVETGKIAIRTYERGVEDETLACGTGMVACALVHHLLHGAASPIQVAVKGGDTLEVGFVREGDGFTDVTLTGPADFTFVGTTQV